MSASQVVECSGACTVTVVHELALPVLNLSTDEAALITSAVLVVWVVGYAFRMVIRTLNIDSGSTMEDNQS